MSFSAPEKLLDLDGWVASVFTSWSMLDLQRVFFFLVWDGNKKYKSLICKAPGESIFGKKRDFFWHLSIEGQNNWAI